MFATRTEWVWREDGLGRAAAERRQRGLPVFDLTETNPTRCGLGDAGRAPELALADPAARAYAPDPFGLPAARAAVAGYYREQGLPVAPDRILLTSGTSEAYGHLMRLLLNPGDALLVPAPSYPLLDVLARLHDVRLVLYPWHYDHRWWLDVEALRAACGADCRGIVVINPGNPTGAMLTCRERAAVTALAAERELAIVADEVFADYRLAPPPDAAGSFAGETRALTFTLNGISKMLALPQMKVAWTVVSGPAARAAEACRRLEVVADAYLSVGTPAQLALPAWLAGRPAVQAGIAARLRLNLAAVGGLRQARALHVDGGWVAVLRIPRVGASAEIAARLLAETGVLVEPGEPYGLGDTGYLVVSLLTEPGMFAAGLRLLDAHLASGA